MGNEKRLIPKSVADPILSSNKTDPALKQYIKNDMRIVDTKKDKLPLYLNTKVLPSSASISIPLFNWNKK